MGMKDVGNIPQELSVEERNLLSVAYKNAVGSRRAAWRIITSIEQKEKSKGNTQNAEWCHEYVGKVEKELDTICNTILTLLNGNLLEKASTDESKVFYHKMKADYYRYIAASNIASAGLPVTHPIRLGLALNFSVFQYEVLG